MTHDHDSSQEQSQEQDGQVSELAPEGGEPTPISPGDSVAAQPEGESGDTQEGTQGPNAAPRHNPPEPGNRSSR
ncbi:hypothetical protein ASC64_10995 [Nocardioides sp. Root122]|uniref:hypothetical protein n=1 Tax=Nocardioides TaxID=1839 RepID=UPI0007034D51|nr:MULTISPECIES: hypothetical protein [Nocardioides]KQV67740.1 hypothetical protein ASC64_10995 [Nocardioides sp. Root122]MCK9823613.1 hypothetical protein [Nocardioides cavernae]